MSKHNANLDILGDLSLRGEVEGKLRIREEVVATAFYLQGGGEITASGAIDHGNIDGLADDDHTQYILVDGTRALSGDLSVGGNRLTSLGAPVSDSDAVRLQDVGPGFYGLTVAQSDELVSFSGVGSLKFESSNFYITQNAPNTDEVQINFRGSTGGGGGASTVTQSGTRFVPDIKPVTVNDASDWFDDNSGNPSLINTHSIDTGKWTLWDVDTVAASNNGVTAPIYQGDATEYDSNVMRVSHDGSTANGWLGYYQAAPAGDFTITAKIGGFGTFEANTFDMRVGVFVADDLSGAPSTSNLFSCALYRHARPTNVNGYTYYEGGEWTDYNSSSVSSVTDSSTFPGSEAWVRIWYRSATTTLECLVSSDGFNWTQILTDSTPGFTPGHIGFGVQQSGNSTITGAIEFFAVSENGSGRTFPAGHGRLIPLITSVD